MVTEHKLDDKDVEKLARLLWSSPLRYEQYKKEFDFTTEARNAETGLALYGIQDNDDHPLQAVAPDVTSMKISNIAPSKKNIMVAEVMDGDTLDTFFKESVGEIRTVASAVFEQDPATGRIKWEDKVDPRTGKTVKKPATVCGISVKTPVISYQHGFYRT